MADEAVAYKAILNNATIQDKKELPNFLVNFNFSEDEPSKSGTLAGVKLKLS